MTTRSRARWLASLVPAALALGPATGIAAVHVVTNFGDSNQPGQLRTIMNEASTIDGDVILIPAGTITLALGPTTETLNAGGDLNVRKNLTFQGAGPGQTVIDGGGLERVFHIASGVTAAIAGLTIRNGRGGPGVDDGLGAYNLGTLALTHVVVEGNLGAPFGAGVFNRGTLTLSHVTIRGNSSDKDGGGLTQMGVGASSTLTNTTISGNQAGRDGGGISMEAGKMSLNNVTITGNRADSDSTGGGMGGGLRVYGGNVIIRNTIIAGNSVGATGTDPDCAGLFTSLGSNLIDVWPGCASSITVNDLSGVPADLGPLAANGGPTPTHLPLPGSSTIDAGDGGCAATDQRGVLRPQRSTAGGPPLCDIGAAEVVFDASTGPLTILPGSGVLWATQGFDLMLILEASGRTVVGGQVLFDSQDVTGAVAGCIVPGTVLTGGQTFRCPGLRGGLLGPGAHALTVRLDLSDGSAPTASVTWQVRADTEP